MHTPTRAIHPLQWQGLNGRVAHVPGPKQATREIVFIYGHHSSIERWWGIIELLSRYASVTMPDLPGFGGMDSLYKLGKPATIDNLADFLADFITRRYPDKKVTVVGMSLGFVIMTRALQRHPALAGHVEMLVSLFGFAHHSDFVLSKRSRRFYLGGSRLFSLPVASHMYKAVALHPAVLRRTYHRTKNAKEKFKHAEPDEHNAMMDFEIKLWHQNDLRTQMKTSAEFLTLDNTRTEINLPVYHIAVESDRYFDNNLVKRHFTHIFSGFHLLAHLKAGSHAPTRIATAEQAAHLVPSELLEKLR